MKVSTLAVAAATLFAGVAHATKLEVQSIDSCKKSIDDNCGKDIKALEEAIEGKQTLLALKSAVAVGKCLGEHAQDITEDCLKKSGVDALMLDAVNVDEASVEGYDDCRDEIHHACGKKIDALKKAIKDTSVTGIVQGSFDLANCLIQDSQTLVKKCLSFDEKPAVMVVEIDTVELAKFNNNDHAEGGPIDDFKACLEHTQEACADQVNQWQEDFSNGKIFALLDDFKAVSKCVKKCVEEDKECQFADDKVMMAEVARRSRPTKMLARKRVIVEERNVAGPIDDIKKCVEEAKKKCKDQIDELDDAVEAGKFFKILEGVKDVATCVGDNFDDLKDKCTPKEVMDALVEEEVVPQPPSLAERAHGKKPCDKKKRHHHHHHHDEEEEEVEDEGDLIVDMVPVHHVHRGVAAGVAGGLTLGALATLCLVKACRRRRSAVDAQPDGYTVLSAEEIAVGKA